MQVIRHGDRGYESLLKRLNRRYMPDGTVRKVVSQILEAVESEGDKALVRFTEEFGGPQLKRRNFASAPMNSPLHARV